MFYVYILRSETHPNQTYIGSTSDLRKRLSENNAGNRPTQTNSNLGTWWRMLRCLKNTSRKNSRDA